MRTLTFNTKAFRRLALLLALCMSFSHCKFFPNWDGGESLQARVDIQLDQETLDSDGVAITSSTQSLNRYASVLRDFNSAVLSYDASIDDLEFSMEKDDLWLKISGLDPYFLFPILPYPHASQTDEFDRANLLLAEYARNGVNLSYNLQNPNFGFYQSNAFSDRGEYIVKDGKYQPNPQVRPKRFSIINNCLNPGLWELSASDAVGEMYHAWFSLPSNFYFSMLSDVNHLKNEAVLLEDYFNSNPNLKEVDLALERLRTEEMLISTSPVNTNFDRSWEAYSSQDSRRKIQRGFQSVVRDGNPLLSQDELKLEAGDQFKLYAFKAPGVYTNEESMMVSFDPSWETAEVMLVQPHTSYEGGTTNNSVPHLEFRLYNATGDKALFLGNIAADQLSFGRDYQIPAFGVGVFPPSESIERRYLRTTSGPVPHYAYLAERVGNQWKMVNNHEEGYEQIYLRPYMNGSSMYIKLTIVSYERIADVMEVSFSLDMRLQRLLNPIMRQFRPPAHEVYSDDNIL